MNQTLRIIISIFGIVLALVSVYFGSFLPYQKAKNLILVMGAASKGVSLEEFKKIYSFQLDYYSPVGQDESIKQLGNTTLTALAQQKKLPRQAVEDLLALNHKYFDPVINAGVGGNFSQDIMLFAQIYEYAAEQTNNRSYLDKSADYFKLGLKHSSARPQFIYGLYTVAKAGGDKESMKKYGQEILKYWPEDGKIREELEGLK